ncbi:hypothetical protein FDE85_02600 [Clostridium botulinum]|nr:hypothetical protein [Clostridium botulinum]NFR89917.1 hypothetical protein [Clostridium botulinum]NFT97951.1 hypothetical protein [Clostridium botulinum]
MSHGFFMNMEKLSLNIARSHAFQMTNDIMYDDVFLDDEKLINNLENGFVVITQLSTFFESFVNTILSNCIKYTGEVLLKCSIEEKIEIIFMNYKKDWNTIKGQNPWANFKKVTKVRNEMIHYKKNFIGNGSGIPNFSIAKISVREFFIQDNMNYLIDEFIKLGDLIASELGLKIFKDINIIECDGRDGLTNYIYDETIHEIDESRFNN